MRSEHKVDRELFVLFDCSKLIGDLEEGEGVTGLKRKIKVKVSTVLNNDLAFLNLIHKDISEANLAFLILLYGVDASTQKHRMRQHIANSLDIDADGPIPSHYVAIYVVVEGLRSLGLKDDLYLCLTLGWNHSVHGFN